MRYVERILVPVDFSPRSTAALDHAAELARALEASITLLHVFEPPTAISTIVPGATLEGDSEAIRAAARSDIDGLVAALHDRGITRVDALVESGAPVETILERAIAGKYQMIIMGTHGRSGFKRLVLGSVAEGVVRRAGCPVVTIHLPGWP